MNRWQGHVGRAHSMGLYLRGSAPLCEAELSVVGGVGMNVYYMSGSHSCSLYI